MVVSIYSCFSNLIGFIHAEDHWYPRNSEAIAWKSIAVAYSYDNGETWILLANNLDSTYFEWVLTNQIPDADSYLVRVVSKCEEGLSAEDVSDGTFSIAKGYNPDVFVGLSVLAISIVAIVFVLFIVKHIGNRV